MPAGLVGDARRLAGVVERRRIEMTLEGATLVRREIDPASRLVHADQRARTAVARHHPVAGCQRAYQPSVEVVEIQMLVSRAARSPDEGGLRGEEGELVVEIHPGRAGLAQEYRRLAGPRVDLEQVEAALIA